MSEVVIREATEQDARPISEIESLSFKTPWSYDMVLSEMREAFSHFYVAFCGDELVGYYGFLHILDELHILNVAVHPSFREQGIGGKLMAHMTEVARSLQARALTLEVRESNHAAIRLYERAGFVLEGTRPHYYMDKENALIYWKEL